MLLGMSTAAEYEDDPGVAFVGPFRSRHVVIDGWRVPFLEVAPRNGGKLALLLDDRYSVDIPVADADRLLRFIADAIAIGMGYTCHPREDWDGPLPRPPFTRARSVEGQTGR
jgi:hypothetical protein